jgi:hypothetical protein
LEFLSDLARRSQTQKSGYLCGFLAAKSIIGANAVQKRHPPGTWVERHKKMPPKEHLYQTFCFRQAA